ncbi:chemotaxis regulatory protein ChePep [Helicobacter pylori]|uniref:chemotaxis regulatory protein ChePep n=1 Tax=Helicobacter pylori TaxID=210 RepID=UPI000B4B8246|nr:chemotaxis regulatory protein ChePep [Helicobacter pylori]
MKMILFNQNPMITKLLESVSKKLELSMEDFNRYQELPTRLKEDSEWILIADDECLEKLDQVDWLELKEIISQNKNSVCMYKKGNEAQPFLEGFEMKIKKPFLPTEVLKILQKKLGSNMSELEPSQNLDPTQEVLETNWDELENLGDLEALVQEEPNNEEQLLPTLNAQEEKEEVKEEEKEEVKEEEKEEVKETPQEEEKPKDDEIQEGETLEDEEVSKELETQEEVKEETQEQAKEQEPTKEETQETKEEKQEKTQDSPSAQELEAMQELVKEIQENSNGQEDKKETQENTETPQEKEKQELETPQEKETQESAETPQDKETQESAETPQDKETQENTETPQELEKQELETQEKTQESAETPQEKTQKLETQEDHYESIEDIPEPVMAQAMGEELPFLNEAVAKTSNNENDTETPKESVIKTPQEKEESIETPKESDKTSSPLELCLNLQDLLNSLNQESLKSLLENKTLSIKITLEDKKPDA